MSVTIDKETVYNAYEDVRSDASQTSWLTLSYDGRNIVLNAIGSDYEEFKSKFTEADRLYGFVRVNTGDEMSRRVKFVLITWVGPTVGALNRAKMSTDKMVVKNVIKNFAIEVLANEMDQLEESSILDSLRKAGGANYGTGVRD